MTDYTSDFGSFDDRIWLNCSHQGPLPRVAVAELQEAISWKVAPHHLITEKFVMVPKRLRGALAKLIRVPEDEIILGNSNSYGLHLLANNIRWKAGDEILIVRGDFPSTILPWFLLQRFGVTVRTLDPDQWPIRADELKNQISSSTKLFCVSWVHSFSGAVSDLTELGRVCAEKGVYFVVNCSQGLGVRPLHVQEQPVDAITSVGFKWLCGPYGTGFCWIHPKLLASMSCNQAYWLSMQTADDLKNTEENLQIKAELGAKAFDVFGTANFFNFKTWTASLEYLLRIGIERLAEHNHQLLSRLFSGLDLKRFDIITPELTSRPNIAVISHKDRAENEAIFQKLKKAGIDVAIRKQNLRITPHLYNTVEQIDQTLDVLNAN